MKSASKPIIFFTALFLAQYVNVAMAQVPFPVWLQALKQEAMVAGILDSTASATISHVELLPRVIELDHSQPEFISPFLNYYYQRVDALKIQKGRELLSEHDALLNQIELQYGVPKSILVAFWGMETQYGSYQGNVDTLSALATLAYDGRRAEFFRGQLLDAMRIIDAGHADIESFKGSWAGAFGHMQFMPTTFMLYAVDGDDDGEIDVINSIPDAFSSAANYLAQVGWLINEPAMVEVQLPENFAWQEAHLMLKKTTGEWAQLGVRALIAENTVINTDSGKSAVVTNDPSVKKIRQSNKISPRKKVASKKVTVQKIAEKSQLNNNWVTTALPNVKGKSSILLPQGWRGPAFMVFDNFDVIMDWNRSVNYALSVAQLAKRLNLESRIIGGQLAEDGALTFQQMFELQAALNSRGYDAGEPDGFPGLKTQAAVRAYQLLQRLPADGYASPSVYEQLMSQP